MAEHAGRLQAANVGATPAVPTSAGSSPNDRVLMTGLRGLLFTSTTGAKLTWTPSARASPPVIASGLERELLVAGRAERHRAREHGRAR